MFILNNFDATKLNLVNVSRGNLTERAYELMEDLASLGAYPTRRAMYHGDWCCGKQNV